MPTSKSIKILYAEDEPPWQKKIRRILETAGYIVEVASDYAVAHDKFTAESFDLIVIDLRLGPDVDNRDGQFLLEDAFKKGIPAIVITGYGTPNTIREAERLDALRFMHKGSFVIEEFRQAVQEVAAKSDPHIPTPQETENLKKLLRRVIQAYIS